MIIIEDGTIIANANSYISMQEADNYLTARGLWQATPTFEDGTPDPVILTKKEQNIIRACDYMNTLIWKGEQVDAELQDLSFPRIFDDEKKEIYTIPKAIKKAQIEIASIFYNGTDLFSPVEKSIIAKTEKVDVISESTTYSESRADTALYNSVMGVLRPYLLKIEGEVNNVVFGRLVV